MTEPGSPDIFDGLPTPSTARRYVKSRVRKLATTYPPDVRITAARQAAAGLTEYADKLEARYGTLDDSDDDPE